MPFSAPRGGGGATAKRHKANSETNQLKSNTVSRQVEGANRAEVDQRTQKAGGSHDSEAFPAHKIREALVEVSSGFLGRF